MKTDKPLISLSEGREIVREAQQLLARQLTSSSRRRFLRNGLTLGGIAMLTGCDLSDNTHVEQALSRISRFNDRVQGWLFNADHLAPVYAESQITRPFPFNAFYAEEEAPDINGEDYRLEVSGLVLNKQPWTLPQLHSMTQISQVTRHICVEGWSAIGKWGRTLCAISAGDWRGPERQLCQLQMRRRLLHQHRYGHGAASANHYGADLRWPDPAA